MERGHSTIDAIVRSLEGGEAWVEVLSGGCGRCHEKGGCGGQSLTQIFCGGPKTYRVSNSIGAGIGERVTIDISPGSLGRSANLAYGVPLLATILVAFLGSYLSGDRGAMIGAITGFGLAMLFLKIRSRESAGNFSDRPHIISRS